MEADFPFWLRASHLFNFVLLGVLIRSGWEILASLPRLWWRNDSKPGTEWLRFTRRKLPKEEGVYTSLMDERSMSPLLALPGRENIGLGRHWHGLGVLLWVVNGLFYVIMLFATGLVDEDRADVVECVSGSLGILQSVCGLRSASA